MRQPDPGVAFRLRAYWQANPNQLSLGMMRTYWTPERDEELQRHAAAGLSAAEIAVLLQTTQSAVRGRSNRLRVSLGTMQTFWTPERDEELQRYAAAGLSAAKIAVLLYTTRGAVLGRSNRLRGKASRMRSASGLGAANAGAK